MEPSVPCRASGCCALSAGPSCRCREMPRGSRRPGCSKQSRKAPGSGMRSSATTRRCCCKSSRPRHATLHRIEGRLARWLLHTRDRTDSDEVPLTQEFLSQMLGVQRTTVNLALRTLQGAGLIRPRRGRVEILDRGKLEQMACECYGIIRDQIAQVLPEAQH
ncbi:MAG TPA: helix-turn-helix domain-containing protein [Xanthobacteraceae bacterium]